MNFLLSLFLIYRRSKTRIYIYSSVKQIIIIKCMLEHIIINLVKYVDAFHAKNDFLMEFI